MHHVWSTDLWGSLQEVDGKIQQLDVEEKSSQLVMGPMCATTVINHQDWLLLPNEAEASPATPSEDTLPVMTSGPIPSFKIHVALKECQFIIFNC